MKTVHDLVTKRLTSTAEKRKNEHDKGTEDVLPVRAEVHLRNRPLGCIKIQDAWRSEVYRIQERWGDVYTIRSIRGSAKAKRVNRRDLKLALPESGSTLSTNGAGLDGGNSHHVSDSDDSGDEATVQLSDGVDVIEETDMSASSQSGDSDSDAEVQSSDSDTEPQTLRRSTRATRGQHSNPHHLPRSALSSL